LDGRTVSLEGYRFGFNTQEKTDEISGAGNHTTALYWEYDSRLGRRWNLDPVYNSDISRYTANGNNPNYFRDPNGDFKTWFGAAVYKGFNGGEIKKAKIGDHKGEWYVKSEGQNKSNEGGGMYRDVYGRFTSSDIIVSKEVSWNWGKGNSANNIDEVAHNVEKQIKYLKRNASNIWNSPIARYYVADFYSVGVNYQISSEIYSNKEVSITVMLRGTDPGIYINSSSSVGINGSKGIDVGVNIGKGYTFKNSRKLSINDLGGEQISFGYGIGLKEVVGGSLNGSVELGLNENKRPSTVSGKLGISVGVGVGSDIIQIGRGYATAAKTIIKQ
jgi:hypothetical protein